MRLWKDILTQIEGLLVPPLSERPTEMRPLSEKEVDVVYKWLGVRLPLLYPCKRPWLRADAHAAVPRQLFSRRRRRCAARGPAQLEVPRCGAAPPLDPCEQRLIGLCALHRAHRGAHVLRVERGRPHARERREL